MTIGKHRIARRIDAPLGQPFASASGDEGAYLTAPPASPTVPAPSGLTLTTALAFSAVTPAAKITAVWAGLEAYDFETYQVQVSTDAGFADASTITLTTAPNQSSATIDNLRISTTYYVRVRAIVGSTPSAWSTSADITTGADTVAPAAPTSAAAAFINGGDLVVIWTNPTSANFRDVEIKIYESAAKVTLYGTFYDATQRFVWGVRANLQATSNAGDASLYVELRSRNWGTAFSAAVTATATKAAPTAPTVTLTKGAIGMIVCQVTSAPESVYSVFEYVWKRDGSTVRTLESPSREQSYELGASGDEGQHSWTVVVRQKDAFGQFSPTTTSTAVTVDALTISTLRANAFYTDSDNNTFTPPASGTLAALKDDNLTSGGVSYAA